MKENKQTLEIRVQTITSLARQYNCHRNTFLRWIKPMAYKLRYREEKRRGLTIREVKFVYEFLGTPGEKIVLERDEL